MILGVDHLALSCEDLSPASEWLQSGGWAPGFAKEKLLNPEAKRPFLNTFEPTHGLCYLRPAQGVAVELTRHASRLGTELSPYQVLLSAELPGSSEFPVEKWPEIEILDTIWRQALGVPPKPRWCERFRVQYWVAEDGDQAKGTSVVAALRQVKHLERSVEFWTKALGFRPEASGDCSSIRWQILSRTSPVAAWSLRAILVEGGRDLPVMLDQAGFSCLALLTNRLEQDLERAVALGAKSCSPFFLTPDTKRLQVAMLRAPGSEMIEFIEVVR